MTVAVRNRCEETSPTLIFLHIPKTGGVTMSRLLAQQFKSGQIYEIDPPNYVENAARLAEQPETLKRSIKLLTGHMAFGVHKCLPQKSVYFTMLRHPVERAISYYYFVRNSRNHPLHDEVVKSSMTLLDLVREQITVELDNGQTRILCGMPDVPWFGRSHVVCTPQASEQAIRNIESDSVISGVTELFDDSVKALNRSLGLSLPLDCSRSNVTKGKPSSNEISSRTWRLIEQMNEYDMALYHKVLEKYERPGSHGG
ncbi:MAG: sulfotransferase family protein [Gammaproteobacteria bacterium]|nr:sulfotransferase family protein [Gammaproteobacteria bacterium]